MKSSKTRSVAPSTQPALELIALARLSPEVARKNLRSLLLANPNHFGNLSGNSLKAVLKIQEDTTYESVGGVGYNPRLKQLRATIQIKKNSGYSGEGYSSGSKEYVRFYLSYDSGETWEDQGLRALEVFDVPEPKPLKYTVTMQLSAREDPRFAQEPQRVRVILSWSSQPPPNEPDWTPVWGNVAEAEIQIQRPHFVPTSTMRNASETGPTQDLAGAFHLFGNPI